MQKSIFILSLFSILIFGKCKKEEPEKPVFIPTPQVLFGRLWTIDSYTIDGVEKIDSVTAEVTVQDPDSTFSTYIETRVSNGTFQGSVSEFGSVKVNVFETTIRNNKEETKNLYNCTILGNFLFEPENDNRLFVDQIVFNGKSFEGNLTQLDEHNLIYSGGIREHPSTEFDIPFKIVCSRE